MGTDMGAWSNFFVMIGSSAAALTGLVFVVVALIAGMERREGVSEGVSTFSSPTVLHFCAGLFASAILLVPWQSPAFAAFVLAIGSIYGTLAVIRVMRRLRRLGAYDSDFEDLLWYALAPLAGYLALLTGSVMLAFIPKDALFVVAAAVVALLIVGIRNAWDVISYIAISRHAPVEVSVTESETVDVELRDSN